MDVGVNRTNTNYFQKFLIFSGDTIPNKSEIEFSLLQLEKVIACQRKLYTLFSNYHSMILLFCERVHDWILIYKKKCP